MIPIAPEEQGGITATGDWQTPKAKHLNSELCQDCISSFLILVSTHQTASSKIPHHTETDSSNIQTSPQASTPYRDHRATFRHRCRRSGTTAPGHRQVQSKSFCSQPFPEKRSLGLIGGDDSRAAGDKGLFPRTAPGRSFGGGGRWAARCRHGWDLGPP